MTNKDNIKVTFYKIFNSANRALGDIFSILIGKVVSKYTEKLANIACQGFSIHNKHLEKICHLPVVFSSITAGTFAKFTIDSIVKPIADFANTNLKLFIGSTTFLASIIIAPYAISVSPLMALNAIILIFFASYFLDTEGDQGFYNPTTEKTFTLESEDSGIQNIKYNLDKNSDAAGHVGIYIGTIKSLLKLIPTAKWLQFTLEMTSKKIAAPIIYKNYLSEKASYHKLVNNKYIEFFMAGISTYLASSSKESLLVSGTKTLTRFKLYQEWTKYKMLIKEKVVKFLYDQGLMDGELVYHLSQNNESDENVINQIHSSKYWLNSNNIIWEEILRSTKIDWDDLYKSIFSEINQSNTCPNDFRHIVLGEPYYEQSSFSKINNGKISFAILIASYFIKTIHPQKENTSPINLEFLVNLISLWSIETNINEAKKSIYSNSSFCYIDQVPDEETYLDFHESWQF